MRSAAGFDVRRISWYEIRHHVPEPFASGDRRLVNWACWCRSGSTQVGTCGSIEKQYSHPQDLVGARRIKSTNLDDALLVRKAMLKLSQRDRLFLGLWYVHMAPFRILKVKCEMWNYDTRIIGH